MVIISQYDLGPLEYNFVLSRYDKYAAIYVARECADSRNRSFAGFRSFVETFDYNTINEEQEVRISQIISSIEQEMALGLPAAEDECMLYVFPATWDEALLSVYLNSVNPANPFYDSIVSLLEQRANRYILQLVDGEEQIFLRCMWRPPFGE